MRIISCLGSVFCSTQKPILLWAHMYLSLHWCILRFVFLSFHVSLFQFSFSPVHGLAFAYNHCTSVIRTFALLTCRGLEHSDRRPPSVIHPHLHQQPPPIITTTTVATTTTVSSAVNHRLWEASIIRSIQLIIILLTTKSSIKIGEITELCFMIKFVGPVLYVFSRWQATPYVGLSSGP